MKIKNRIAEIFQIDPEQADNVINVLDIGEYAELMSYIETNDLEEIERIVSPYVEKYISSRKNTISENHEERSIDNLIMMALDEMPEDYEEDYFGWAKEHTNSFEQLNKFKKAITTIAKVQNIVSTEYANFQDAYSEHKEIFKELGVSRRTVRRFVNKDLKDSEKISESLYKQIAADVKRLMKINNFSAEQATKALSKEKNIPVRNIEYALEIEKPFMVNASKISESIDKINLMIGGKEQHNVLSNKTITEVKMISEYFKSPIKERLLVLCEMSRNDLEITHANLFGFSRPCIKEWNKSNSQLIDSIIFEKIKQAEF